MTEKELWAAFCRVSGTDAATPYQAWEFGGSPDLLAALVALGVKTATASAYDLCALDSSEPMPQPGDRSVILDSRENAVCVIRTDRLRVLPFRDVDAEQARREGEGDRSLAYWRQTHNEFFRAEYERCGAAFTEDSPILCEEFSLLYSLYTAGPLTDEEAREAVAWRYDGEYAVYNFPSWDECAARGWSITDAVKRENAYFSVWYAGEFLGFFHIMDRAGHVELGVGMKPELCGQGRGRMFLALALAKILETRGCTPVQLAVRTFNTRAVRCYERAGFRIIDKRWEALGTAPGEMYIMQTTL